MFKCEEKKEGFYISADKIKGKFGPFIGIICKSKYLGDTGNFKATKLGGEKNFLEKKYCFTKYSIGFSKEKIFVINENGVEEILEK